MSRGSSATYFDRCKERRKPHTIVVIRGLKVCTCRCRFHLLLLHSALSAEPLRFRRQLAI